MYIILVAKANKNDIKRPGQPFPYNIYNEEKYLIKVDNGRDYLYNILKKVLEQSKVMLSNLRSIYNKANAQTTYYFDVDQNFLSDFKNLHGSYPATPVSATLYPIYDPSHYSLVTSDDSDKMKFTKSLALMLSDVVPTLQHFIGLESVYSNYASVTSGAKISDAEFKETALNIFKNNKAQYGFVNLLVNAEYANAIAIPESPGNSISLTILPNLVKVIEDSYINENIKNMYSSILGGNNSNIILNRDQLLSSNIIDLNIVPVDAQVFMRDIPFANVYNFSYTYDKFVAQIFNDGIIYPGGDKKYNNTKHIIGQLLTHPYKSYNNIKMICSRNGNDHINNATPRYLSDQIYGKVLMQTESTIVFKFKTVADLVAPNEHSNKLAYLNPNIKPHKFIFVDYVAPTVTDVQVKARSDNYMVHSLVWIVSMQRVMREYLTSRLTNINNVIVRGVQLSQPDFTEYQSSDTAGDIPYGDDPEL